MSIKREYTEMTADAKVGLLLGLVFIAIIAFVINGLPDFVHSVKEKPVVETAVTTQTGGGNLVIEPAVVDVARSLQDKRTTVRYVDPPVDTTVLDQYAGPSSASLTAPSTPVTGDTASDTAKAVESPAGTPRIETTTQVVQETVEPIQNTKQSDTVVASKPQPAALSGLSHVVDDGESLGQIAKKYYGEEEGNKLSTIQMLYEANKNILESPDEIRAGDQLVIPKMKSALIPEQTTPVKKETASSTLMDKFKNVFTSVDKKSDVVVKNSPAVDKKTPSKPQTPVADKTALQKMDKSGPVKTDKSKPVKGVTEYTVQSGDYLYKIAQKQLGDGNRFPEITKLNSDVLSGSDRLQVGMKLRIPKQ
jgi:nucleoid-associated protein YgaU